MQIKLYPCFAHWLSNKANQNNTIWLISDPHFNDGEMKYLRKDYIGDDEQVRRINSKVAKNDTIIFLGDIGDLSYIKRIRGYKVLIMGNHDQGMSNYVRKVTKLLPDEYDKLPEDSKRLYQEYDNLVHGKIYLNDNHLFDEVYDGTLQINSKIMLSHEPIEYPYCLNIHGHDHSNWYKGDQNINLCAEHLNYLPVNLNDIIKSGKLKNIADIHRETIDRASEKRK